MRNQSTPSTHFDPARDRWLKYTPIEGEVIDGTVLRLPSRHTFNGSRLFVRRDDNSTIGFPATAKTGHTLLERALREQQVHVGDHIVVRYFGKRTTADGERSYRFYRVDK